jgi:hypothetical protein
MYKYVEDFKFPILDGMVPLRRLPLKYLHVREYLYKTDKEDKFPIESGMIPVSLLTERSL